MLFDGTDSPTVAVEVDLGQKGYFTLGVSSLGGPDVLASSLPLPSNWSAFPATVVRSVSTRRGRTREDQAVQPGTATIVLDNRSGQYDPDNPTGPYLWNGYTVLAKGLPLRVRAGMASPADLEAQRLLRTDAVWYIDAQGSGSSDSAAVNLGSGGSALNAAQPTTANQPKFLSWSGSNYVYLPGVAGNYLSAPNDATLAVTDLDLRVQVSMDDWTPAASQLLFAKWTGGVGTCSYFFYVTAAGRLEYNWSADGTNQVGAKTSTVSTGVTDGTVKWVRVVHDVDNGAAGNDVKFYTSDDGSAWTQLGTTVTTAGTTSIATTASVVNVGSYQNGSLPAAGKFFRAIVKNGIDGPTVLDVDCTIPLAGSATSFTARTGQTVTVNRASTGRKTVVVTQPCWLFGTDDYLEVPDNDLLDFTATDSFSVVLASRGWTTAGGMRMSKIAAVAGTNGWELRNNLGASGVIGFTGTGATWVQSSGTLPTTGAVAVSAMVVDRGGATNTAYLGATPGATVALGAVGTLANSDALWIGRQATTYSDGELFAGAVFRRVLTAAEISALNTYFSSRPSTPVTLYPIYTGYVEDVVPDQSLDPTTTITATDALAWLGSQPIDTIVAAYSGDSTAARAGRILDAVGWSATARSLSGARIMRDTTYGQTALALVEEAARCENGIMYATRDGVLTMLPYQDTFSTTQRLTLSDSRVAGTVEYDNLSTSPGAAYLTNTVNITTTTGTVVTYANAGSVARFGTYEKGFTAPLLNGTEASALAQSMVERFAYPNTRVNRVEFDALNYGTLWPSILQTDLAERLRIERTTVDGRNRIYGAVIESVSHDISTGGWRVGYDLSPGASSVYFILGTSVLGGTDQLYY